MIRIDEIGKEKDVRVKEMDEHLERAEHIRTEIDKVKEAVKEIPEAGLDEELQNAIKEAEEAARDEAGKDGEELMEAQRRTETAIENLNNVISEKTEIYGNTIHIIEKYKVSDYGKALETSQRQAEEGVQKMEDIRVDANKTLGETLAALIEKLDSI